MTFSAFGERFNQHAGITQLMDDLNDGLRTPGAVMLGGGNPAQIPEMNDYFGQAIRTLIERGDFVDALTNYDGPQGSNRFLKNLANLLQQEFGWPITEKNITLTNGSQSAFFYLFNLFAGKQCDGSDKKILLPLAPEYCGYADSGLDPDIFVSCHPEIELLADRQFKYHIDFDRLTVNDSIGAICVSRPTNPTGNVLTDDEVVKLDKLARENDIPLIIDNAYGAPFPSILFESITPFWNDNTILCMSLSKLGLPGVRCGIVIGNEEVITALSNLNGIISLAPASVGPKVASHMIEQGDLLRLSENVIKPYYQQKSQQAIKWLQQAIPDPRFRIHKSEGAIFLWLWFDELPIDSKTLYQRLKARGVLVVPGEYFFFGAEERAHSRQCLRMNYVQSDEVMQKGIDIIAQEVEKAYQEEAVALAE